MSSCRHVHSTIVDTVLTNQEAQQAVLTRHALMLQAIFTLVTLQLAANEQRRGRNMLFDELCTLVGDQVPTATPDPGENAEPSAMSTGCQVSDGVMANQANASAQPVERQVRRSTHCIGYR